MKYKTDKYIRVPNGIIDRTTYDSDTFVIDYAIKHNFPSSNNLAELCDEFVVFDKNEKPHVYSPFDLKTWKTDNKLFGAIWTNRGLLYVAKLNDKGKLELI